MTHNRHFSPDKMKAVLRDKAISKRELGRRIYPEDAEMIRPALNRHLRGVVEPKPETIQRYADALEVSFDDLTDEEPEPDMALLEAKVDAIRARAVA